jgi:hypothetical protein
VKRLLVACAAAAAVAAAPAAAYVRTRTSAGTPIAWRRYCPRLQLGGPDHPELPATRLLAALTASAEAWNTPTAACANPPLAVEAVSAAASDVGFDGLDVVLWRLPGFCDDPAHADDDVCGAPNATAVTTAFFVDRPGDPSDGELLEADVELNAVSYRFDDAGAPDRIDLLSTLTHELGHVYGLDHTCRSRPGPAPLDSAGAPVPFCLPTGALSPDAVRAVMFPFEQPGETDKRGPTDEESRGVCTMYAGRAATCARRGADGCRLGASPRDDGWLLVGAALLLFRWRRRWRGRARAQSS